jgi:predicted membrane-bound spermidine synthase
VSVDVVLPLVFLLSGAAGLIFELVWFHRTGLAFGNSIVAATIVLSSFMGGLAIGNGIAGWLGARVRRLLRLYAALEATTAIAGLALTYLLPELARVQLPLAAAFVLLLVPASAMGATLPIVVAAIGETGIRLEPDATTVERTSRVPFGTALGLLYGCNTLGAVGGVLIAEPVLIARVGVAGSAWIAAALDALDAAIALMLSFGVDSAGRSKDRPLPIPTHESFGSDRPSGRPSALVAPIIACAFLAGLTLLALEVLWFRFLSMFVLTTTLVMSVMLGVVLSGIALGALAAAEWLKHRPFAAGSVATIALTAAVATVASYGGFNLLTSGAQVGEWTRVAWFATVMTLPTSCLSGALFTLLGEALRRTRRDDVGAAASLTLANTVGAACGPPVAAFVLLPAFGTERALFALSLAYVVVGTIALSTASRPMKRTPAVFVAAGIAAIALVWFPFGAMTASYLPRVMVPYAVDGSQIVATREGPSESIVLMQQLWMGKPVYNRLVTNGFSMSGTAIPGQRYMRYFVYWPMLLHEAPLERILVICYGVGVTAGAALDVPSAASIDVVEISRDVVAMSDVIYTADRNPLHDGRVKLHIGDGRRFLRTTAERYDLITGEPPPPRTPGAVNIYTREYFALIRDRLADGGMTTYWLPVARPNPGTDVDTIIRAFCDVFDDCSLWNATPFDLMLVGTRGAREPVDARRLTSAFTCGAEVQKCPIADRLREIGFETPEQIGATFLGDAAYLNDLTAATPPLTDDFPQRLRPVEARSSLSDPRYPADLTVVARYQRLLNPSRARDAFASSGFIKRLWPAGLIESSRPWFDEQRMINRVLWEGGKPLRLIEDLTRVLTLTPLRTLPLWMLGSDDVKQQIASTGNDGSGTVEYVRGAQLMAARDYESAASYFGLAERRGLRTPPPRPMTAYALCRANRIDMSKKIVDSLQPRDEDERHFVEWMRMNCS